MLHKLLLDLLLVLLQNLVITLQLSDIVTGDLDFNLNYVQLVIMMFLLVKQTLLSFLDLGLRSGNLMLSKLMSMLFSLELEHI